MVEQFDVPYAFVVQRDDKNSGSIARRRKLRLGQRHDLLIVVEGLAAGEQLVVVGQESLADGTPIKVVAGGVKPPS